MKRNAIALTLVALAIVGLAFATGCDRSSGISGGTPEKTYSVKCSDGACGWADAAFPETPYKALEKDESGKLKCPLCHKPTLVEGGK